mmetsp:Transcript_12995/g.14484  ORF Transcript_12995/g.14484 Transcript_12995/m.14484 type:complete len:108 (+) Transcript_12995:210-533(+)
MMTLIINAATTTAIITALAAAVAASNTTITTRDTMKNIHAYPFFVFGISQSIHKDFMARFAVFHDCTSTAVQQYDHNYNFHFTGYSFDSFVTMFCYLYSQFKNRRRH